MIAGFPPVAAADARLLILGSIPGRASLQHQQYYAHPRNAFWPIIIQVFGAAPDLPYPDKLRLLTDHGIALWDVIGQCRRPTSLDSDIEPVSVQVNDFSRFLAAHRHIATICFNGTTAEATFRRRILPFLDLERQPLTFHRLPSTSPANAGCSYADKLARWRSALTGGDH
ncbi:DNA-deoxyinosine glycosylase [Desulfoprunum benzoelyticum]|uniref:Hypoxanthine-DNA glycosylase n=1 Tax=Desulfoprunum benzoelyticum TaxID=1506996 RepID=A0A840V694_9BACT|nr:DNA-deoxyinosine glycosylase [Desulfoprunum benzoelyticum]MBB5349279.1 hypoxanthine-DNA glycosylase [Desulfoprunum benzoelyticum]MBM9530973.1 DNA-deoxyinosine glycosylase [Desulfoprunum benzoelyticum]